jgi:hypothetical protein
VSTCCPVSAAPGYRLDDGPVGLPEDFSFEILRARRIAFLLLARESKTDPGNLVHWSFRMLSSGRVRIRMPLRLNARDRPAFALRSKLPSNGRRARLVAHMDSITAGRRSFQVQ